MTVASMSACCPLPESELIYVVRAVPSRTSALAVNQAEEKNQRGEVLQLVHLKRRNWENHGTDTTIESDGTYHVNSSSLGKTKSVRNGVMRTVEREDLLRKIIQVGVFDLQQEYSGPTKTPFSWWGYELTIKTNLRSQRIRFHSEDDTVPAGLKDLVDNIINVTN